MFRPHGPKRIPRPPRGVLHLLLAVSLIPFACSAEPVQPKYGSTRAWQPYDGAKPVRKSAPDYLAVPFMPVAEVASPGSIPIAGDGAAAAIFHSAGDAAVVGIAANALGDDVARVTGLRPAVSTAAPTGRSVILIGTVGESPLIDALVKAGKIDVKAIAGKWEAYTAAVVAQPLPGVEQALVIAGSDRRGTAFGVFGLSEAMGVSPWYWWGDVPVEKKAALHVAGSHTQGSPGVKYRGIFLNDEDWGLQPWAAKTFEPETGNIGPKTYATIFELLLRLHANFIWPAMHHFPVPTTPFYQIPENKLVADRHAIVIGTSHHEPMLRNSYEYDEQALGPYNYWTNRDRIYDFWDKRVAETAGFENIYTIGMRGRDDAGMLAPAGVSTREKARKIQDGILPDQREMIARHVNADPSQVPQVFIPYKETLVQYQSGLHLPDDITILWPDDNHGYIRQLPNAAERARRGGSGVYYHLSYWGVPLSYLWLCTTPPGMTCSEMIKAWDFEANTMWLVNVGDLKPHEIGTEFFLRMARDPEAFRDFDQHAYFTQWAERAFGPAEAKEIATVLDAYFRLNIVKRPEHLDRTRSGFSLTENGDEAAKRLDEFAALTKTADAIYARLPDDRKAAFYEMILYPVRGSNLVNRRTLLAERSRLWAEQKRAATHSMAAEAKAAHDALLAETRFYNETNVGGKWNRMLSPMPVEELPKWARETQNPFIMPALGNYTPPDNAALGVAIEGSDPDELPRFDRVADPTHFIDVFATGNRAISWTAVADAPWMVLSQARGEGDARIQVRIDWAKAPHDGTGTITLESAGSSRSVRVRTFDPPDSGGGVAGIPNADRGVVVLEAEDFSERHDRADGTGWRKADRATASGDGMTLQPVTAASLDPKNLPSDTPTLTYRFQAVETGATTIRTECLPTHRITSDHPGVRFGVSLNGEPPKIVDIHANEYTPAWNANTLRASAHGITTHQIDKPGVQTLTLWMVDPGVVLDKIVVETRPDSAR